MRKKRQAHFKSGRFASNQPVPCGVLQARDIVTIDQALCDAGPDGQVHLLLEAGHIAVIRTLHARIASFAERESKHLIQSLDSQATE